MATEAGIQAILDPAGQGKGAKLARSYYDLNGTPKTTWYVLGNISYPGKAKFVTTTTGDSDATQAAAIQAAMAAGPVQ